MCDWHTHGSVDDFTSVIAVIIITRHHDVSLPFRHEDAITAVPILFYKLLMSLIRTLMHTSASVLNMKKRHRKIKEALFFSQTCLLAPYPDQVLPRPTSLWLPRSRKGWMLKRGHSHGKQLFRPSAVPLSRQREPIKDDQRKRLLEVAAKSAKSTIELLHSNFVT